jgi:replication factor A1
MSTEEIIQQILSQRPEIKQETVLEKLCTAREKTGGLIADTTLLRVVAAEFGVEILRETMHDHKLSIGHLVSGLNNVTVTGRVVAVYPVKTFEGAKPGKFASATIVDKDGAVRVILWNEKANVIESGELKTGQIVRFSHGYTKEDRDGKVELHLGNKSEVSINPENVTAEDYPLSIDKFATKIGEITKTHKSVSLKGTVKQVFSPSTFTRQDQTTGTVIRFVLADDTGEVIVIVWNEKAQEVEKSLQKNAEAQLINGRVKIGSNGEIEIHADTSTYLDIAAAPINLTKISSLDENLDSVNVEGEVSTLPTSKEITTSKGETVKLCNFELKDDTGSVWVSAWRQHAETACNLMMGNKILVENAYVRKGYDGKKELSTRTATVITRV